VYRGILSQDKYKGHYKIKILLYVQWFKEYIVAFLLQIIRCKDFACFYLLKYSNSKHPFSYPEDYRGVVCEKSLKNTTYESTTLKQTSAEKLPTFTD
jgi:hypothetical protein